MLRDFFARFSGSEEASQPAHNLTEKELYLASAALLIHSAWADGEKSPEEEQKLKSLLSERFSLEPEDADTLIIAAQKREKNAVDLYGFTRVLTRELDQEGRKKMVEMLWEVVLCDGIIDDFEDHLVRQTAELLGVSTRDRISLKKRVQERL